MSIGYQSGCKTSKAGFCELGCENAQRFRYCKLLVERFGLCEAKLVPALAGCCEVRA
jgi:hypothetical protein